MQRPQIYKDYVSDKLYDDHIGLNTTNSTKYFIHPDSSDRFYRNLDTQEPDWHYKNSDKILSYNIDNYGFRNNHAISEVSKNPYIVTVGCSHTMGMGNFFEENYSYQIERITGIPVVNLGLAGSSNEVSFFNLMWLLNNFNHPKVIIFQRTGINRFPIWPDSERLYFAGPWVNTWDDIEFKDLEKFIEMADRFGYNKLRQKMMQVTLQQLCKCFGIKLIFFDLELEILSLTENLDHARDLVHYGPKTHSYLANLLVNQINT